MVRFGNKLGILVGMLLGAIFGGTSVAAIDLVKGDVNAMQAWVSVDVSMNVNVIFAVVGVATYLVSGILAVRMTQKIEAEAVICRMIRDRENRGLAARRLRKNRIIRAVKMRKNG